MPYGDGLRAEVAGLEALQAWMLSVLYHIGGAFPVLAVNFGGDRLEAVRDGGGVLVRDVDRQVVAAATWSPTGEYGQPSVVGLWGVTDEARALALATAAQSAHEAGSGIGCVRFDAVSMADMAAVRMASKDIVDILEVNNFALPWQAGP